MRKRSRQITRASLKRRNVMKKLFELVLIKLSKWLLVYFKLLTFLRLFNVIAVFERQLYLSCIYAGLLHSGIIKKHSIRYKLTNIPIGVMIHQQNLKNTGRCVSVISSISLEKRSAPAMNISKNKMNTVPSYFVHVQKMGKRLYEI